jgi:hypothetical protein
MSAWERGLLVLVLAYGVVLRAWDLGGKPFRVDEAESSINALTILQHGLPVNHYLGLPIFENTLTRSWPESPEYEFKDTSYSERGLAIYHGWLPLYVTAAGFALAGVSPDRDPTALRGQHSVEEMRGRTVMGRLPAAAFGAVFLVAIFFAAGALYGRDAAWAAVAAGTVCEPAIYFARQARYYSATLALTACCCLLIWRMLQHGRWRDFLLGAIVFVLLFHSHVLSFAVTCAALGLLTPFLFRHARCVANLATFAVIVSGSILPWAVLTGFVASAAEIPKARSLLSLQDLWTFLGMLGLFPMLAILTFVWLLVGRVRGRLPDRLVRPFADHRGAFLWLAGWGMIGLVAFIGLMPAVSFFYGRIVLTVLVPGLLFGALLFAAIARLLAPRYSSLLASALFILALIQAGQATFWESPDPGTPLTFDLLDHVGSLDLLPDTRIYATPNYHLPLMFYTGLPIQSVAPVRKSFLDNYEGELLIVEAGPRYEPLTWQEIQQTLSATDHPASEAEARRLEPLLATRLLREELGRRVAHVTPELEPDQDFFRHLFLAQQLKTAKAVMQSVEKLGNPMFRGYMLPDYLICWQTFFYRFVNPEARTGQNVNYAARIRDANAVVLPGEWVIYHCPARRKWPNGVD